MSVSIDKGRKSLTVLWFLLSGASFLLVLTLTLSGFYGNDFGWVWNWFLPTILPTLSLIIGVLVADTRRDRNRPQTVDRLLYGAAWWLSAGYLGLVLGTLLLQPVVTIEPHDLLTNSHFWLAPFQGLVSGSLGAFFVRSENVAEGDAG